MKKTINGKEYTLPCLLHKNGIVWGLNKKLMVSRNIYEYGTHKYLYSVYCSIFSGYYIKQYDYKTGYDITCDKKYCNPKVLYTENGEWHWR